MITLGIIGVVAAMTVPNLIANTRGQQYRVKLQKTISTLSNAARLSQSLYDFDYAGVSTTCGSNGGTHHPDTTMSPCAILNGTLTGFTYYNKASDIPMNNKQGTKYTVTGGTGSGYYVGTAADRTLNDFHAYVLNDGTIVAVHKRMGEFPCSMTTENELYGGTPILMTGCSGFIDVNGVSLPNKEVTCISGAGALGGTCVVKNDAMHKTDIYPIRFHDGIVTAGTSATRYIINNSK